MWLANGRAQNPLSLGSDHGRRSVLPAPWSRSSHGWPPPPRFAASDRSLTPSRTFRFENTVSPGPAVALNELFSNLRRCRCRVRSSRSSPSPPCPRRSVAPPCCSAGVDVGDFPRPNRPGERRYAPSGQTPTTRKGIVRSRCRLLTDNARQRREGPTFFA